LDFHARRSRTGLYCSRHCVKIRLALQPLATPKNFQTIYKCPAAARLDSGVKFRRKTLAYWFVLLAPSPASYMGSDHVNSLKNCNFPVESGTNLALKAVFYHQKGASKSFPEYQDRLDPLRHVVSMPKRAFQAEYSTS